MTIYVETLIRAPMDALWTHTQDPRLHVRWDLRFTEIAEASGPGTTAPRRFRYSTRVAPGVVVAGEGVSTARRHGAEGGAVSALRFGSASRLSLILEGGGYWRYVPTGDGIRFLTGYDYHTRFGLAGALVDRWLFRPLIGWATAWSFDRLRLWLEDGILPAHAARQAVVHGIARVGLAAVFAYHGLVPKLLASDADERSLFVAAGVPDALAGAALVAAGAAEVALAVGLLGWWHRAWPPITAGAFAVVATAGVAATSPSFLGAAFNPVTLNLTVACLAAIDILTLDGLPSAARCRRRPTDIAAR